jgi:hypothetical protein
MTGATGSVGYSSDSIIGTGDKNIIVYMDEVTGRPKNYYLYRDMHYAEQFPRNWAVVQLPKTGPECDECMNYGTWCGVMLGYCRKCATLYDGERGPGFVSPGVKHGNAMNDVVLRKVGKTELLEEELRRYYYRQNTMKLYRKMEKTDNKLRCRRDTLGGAVQLKLAQLERRREIRQTAIARQLKKSIKIELQIYSDLQTNQIERLRENKTDITVLEKSIAVTELSIGKCYSDATYWDGEQLTRLGEEQIHRSTRKIRDLRHQKRRLEEGVASIRVELNRIEDYIGCLRNGDLLPPTEQYSIPVSLNADPDPNTEWSRNRFSAYNDAIGKNEVVIEELTHEINTTRRELGQYGDNNLAEIIDEYDDTCSDL